VEVYEKALKQQPNSGHFKHNLGYFAEMWAKDTYDQDGLDKAKEVLALLRRRFPNLAEVKRAPAGFARRVAKERRDAGDYQESLALIDRCGDLSEHQDDLRDLARNVYDAWARSFSKEKDWGGAVDVYAKGLRRYPGDGHLTNNLVYTVQEWARDAYR